MAAGFVEGDEGLPATLAAGGGLGRVGEVETRVMVMSVGLGGGRSWVLEDGFRLRVRESREEMRK